MIGATFVAVAVGFPETKWHRAHPHDVLAMTPSVPSSDEKIAEKRIEHTELDKAATPREGLQKLTHAQTAERDPWLHKGSPSKQQFKLFQPNKSKQPFIVLP